MQYSFLEQGVSQSINQGLQLHTTTAHPARERGARDNDTGPGKLLFLPMQW